MSDEGFLRPEPEILGSGTLVPAENLVRPPPNRFTHEVVGRAPFYYRSADQSENPDGTLEPGTKVVVLVHDPAQRCRVVDERGLYVEVGASCLTELGRP